jgi:predicted transcriptional regulator
LNRESQILTVIQNNPGIHIRGLMKETGMESGVITYHLNKLEKKGIIKSQKRTKHRRYFLVEIPEEQFAIIRNTRKPTKMAIMLEIIVQGSPTFQDLVGKLNKSPSTISWNIAGLIKDGIIEKCTINGKKCYQVKNKKLFLEIFHNQLKKLFTDKFEHVEDIFLAL